MQRPAATTGRRILVTGGCGFIGAAVAEAFAEAGHRVTAVDVRPRRFDRDVAFIEQDVTEAVGLAALFEGVDSVIHCASVVHTKTTGAERVRAVNRGGTLDVLRACQRHGVSRLVHISSASVVNEGRDIEHGDESLPYARYPTTPYVESKIAAERAVLALAGQRPTRVCALRPHLVFGPGGGRFVPNILKSAAAGGLREIGYREKLSEFTYISNLVDAVVAAEADLVERLGVAGQAFFVTNAEPRPMFEFAEELVSALEYPPIRGGTPYWVAYAWAAMLETLHAIGSGGAEREDGLSRFAVSYLATHHYFSTEKARRALGWSLRVSLADGIGLTVEALRDSSRSTGHVFAD